MLLTFSECLEYEYVSVELSSVYGTMPICAVCGQNPKAFMRPHHRMYPLRQGDAPYHARLLYFRSLAEKDNFINKVMNRDRISSVTYSGFHLNCSPWCRTIGIFLISPAGGAQVALARLNQSHFQPTPLIWAAGKAVAQAVGGNSDDYCANVGELPIPNLVKKWLKENYGMSFVHITDHQFQVQNFAPPCQKFKHAPCCCTCN